MYKKLSQQFYKATEYMSILELLLLLMTKFMIELRKTYSENECVRNLCNFEIVKDYTHLGTVLTNKSELRPQIEKIIRNASRSYYALVPLLKSQSEIRKKNHCDINQTGGKVRSSTLDTEQRYF